MVAIKEKARFQHIERNMGEGGERLAIILE
jgi:hypothetical protein